MSYVRSPMDSLPEGTLGAVTVGSGCGHGAVWGAIEDAWAEDDSRRAAELSRMERERGHCRFCGEKVTEASMERHPGLCGRKECVRQAKKLEKALREMRGTGEE